LLAVVGTPDGVLGPYPDETDGVENRSPGGKEESATGLWFCSLMA